MKNTEKASASATPIAFKDCWRCNGTGLTPCHETAFGLDDEKTQCHSCLWRYNQAELQLKNLTTVKENERLRAAFEAEVEYCDELSANEMFEVAGVVLQRLQAVMSEKGKVKK